MKENHNMYIGLYIFLHIMKQHLHYHRQVLRRRHSGGLKLLECNSNITNITRITHHPYLSLNMICSSHKKKLTTQY